MYVAYGTYQHDANEVSLDSIVVAPVTTEQGRIWAHDHVWVMSGQIYGTDQDDLTTKLAALQTAYSVNGKDLILYQDNGSVSVHELRTRDAIGGVQIVEGPSFPDGKGAEYSTFRTYQIRAQARIPVAAAGNNPLEMWAESIVITGNGGPRVVVQELADDPPELHEINRYTAVRASQTGEAVGKYAYPLPPNPIWPNYLVNPDASVEKSSPKIERASSTSPITLTDFRIKWNYQFVAPGPLAGNPTIRG